MQAAVHIAAAHARRERSPAHRVGKVATEPAGQLFTEWNVRLDRSCAGGYCSPAASVLIYVDGTLYEGDPGAIELTDGKQIAIVIGTPPTEIPASYRF